MYTLPKKIWINGEQWTVEMNPKIQKSQAVWERHPTITIGTCGASDEYILGEFLHEVIEAVLMTKHLRYGSNSHMFFLFDHKDFTSAVMDIVMAVKDCWKKNKKEA